MDTSCLTDDDLLALSEGRLGVELRAPLHRHLARCSSCMLLFSAMADTGLAQTCPTLADAPEPEETLTGRLVCGYRVGPEIGRGAMGAVYAAVHPHIGQRAAVKVLFRELSGNPQFIQRFRTEARATSAVQHASLLTIFNHGQLPDGTAYILMEYLEGQSLRHKLAEHTVTGQRIPAADVLRIGRQIASAMDAVHRHGIVHRDLKPSNVMLVPDPDVPSGERAKVVDFGLARMSALPSGCTTATATQRTDPGAGHFIGTAAYAAPEQCRMDSLGDCRADVYALGVMLYEMLAGTLPFVGAPLQLLQQHLETPPRPLQQVTPGLPAALYHLVHRMLAKAPEQRPSMAQVRDQLLALQSARPRRPAAGAVFAVAGLLLLLAGLAVGWLAQRVPVDVNRLPGVHKTHP